MKSSTYARITLLLPYIALIKPIYDFITKYYYSNVDSSAENINFWLIFSALFWIIPYTILAIGLLVWSRGKSIEYIRVAYLFAPQHLAVITPVALIMAWILGSLVMQDMVRSIGFGIILGIAACVSIPASLVVGYFFVGISLLGYKILQRFNLIKD